MNGDYERIDQHPDDALEEWSSYVTPETSLAETVRLRKDETMNRDYFDQHMTDALLEGDERARDFLARWTLRDRSRPHPQHRHFLTPSPTPLTSISDLLLSWSRGEWLIIDSHSYHPDFYINWRLRKLMGAVMRGKVYRAMGEDGEVYRVEGWESEHKEGGL